MVGFTAVTLLSGFVTLLALVAVPLTVSAEHTALPSSGVGQRRRRSVAARPKTPSPSQDGVPPRVHPRLLLPAAGGSSPARGASRLGSTLTVGLDSTGLHARQGPQVTSGGLPLE